LDDLGAEGANPGVKLAREKKAVSPSELHLPGKKQGPCPRGG